MALMIASAMMRTTTATTCPTWKSGLKQGSVCPLPPAAVILRKVAKQFTDGGVGGLLHRAVIEAARFELHQFQLLAHGMHAERPYQPHGAAADESGDILAPNQRNVLAEALAVEVEQAI